MLHLGTCHSIVPLTRFSIALQVFSNGFGDTTVLFATELKSFASGAVSMVPLTLANDLPTFMVVGTVTFPVFMT
jgi:hypothetical protein